MKQNLNFLFYFFCIFILNQSNFLIADNCNTRCASSKCKTDSKTFFRTRSAIEDVSFFLGLNQYNYYRRYFEPDACDSQDERVHIAAGAFFEKSHPNARNNVGRFLFSGGSNTDVSVDCAIPESVITVMPERKIAGAYFDYHQDFCCWSGLWVDAKFAIYEATHSFNAKERNICNVSPTDCTALCFLSSDVLKFGRIPTCKLKKTGFDDIEIKLGYNFVNCRENGYFGIYASALLPTAAKPTAEFLFEPLIGRGHWGIGAGINFARNIYRSENTSLTFLTDFSYQYLFKGNELRSLDVKSGQLTRFMAANIRNNIPTAVPAINHTTLNLEVEPRGVINFWFASHLQYCRWHVEAGYNLWWRQSEKICFKKCQTNSFNNLGIFDPEFIPLTLNNLDLASTSHPQTLTNKIYLALSYDVQTCCRPINIGVAGSYEFSRNINSFEQWGVWVNLETSF